MDKQCDMLATRLQATLQAMTGLHEELLALMNRKREALRSGNARLMSELCALENQKVQAISELEKQRLELAARLTLAVEPGAKEPLRMAELAERLPEPTRGHLLVTRQRLREQIAAVKEQTSVARRAADQLTRHVHGLVQAISSVSRAGGTYGKAAGGPPRAGAAMSTFSMTA